MSLNYNYTEMKHIVFIPLFFIIFLCSCTETKNNEKETADTKGYPEYYGGSYIKDRTLFIITSKNNIQVRKDLENRGKGANFLIETLNNNLQKGISDKLDSLGLDFYKYPNLNYYSHHIDNKKQKIVVMLSDTTKENYVNLHLHQRNMS